MTYFQNKLFIIFFYYLEFLNSDGDTNCYTWFSLGTDVCFHTYEARFITPVPWIVFKTFNPTTLFCFCFIFYLMERWKKGKLRLGKDTLR